MAADTRYTWLRILDVLVERIWNDIYDGIIVDQPGTAPDCGKRRDAGPIVLVPSHKSHIDYLVLSWVLFREGMMPPHIAAGDKPVRFGRSDRSSAAAARSSSAERSKATGSTRRSVRRTSSV